MSLDNRYPSTPYLANKARRRIPHFAWEYLASDTGAETALDRNRQALDAVRLLPRVLKGGSRSEQVQLGVENLDAIRRDFPIGSDGIATGA